ncbi:MAG: translocation/assembly module TamB [Paludibacteraceae bacterium]|nr:translocation/assembly module TamB [Paludibacteraceae bacterium]
MKRLLVILGVLLLCSLLTVGAFVLSIRSGKVQTAAIAYLTEELSKALDADISVDQVDIRFFNRLTLNGVYVSDQSRDTLVYIPELSVRFNPFALEQDRLDFPMLRITRPYVNFKQDSTTSNLDFLLRAFSKDDSVKTPFLMKVNVDDVFIDEARVRYRYIPEDLDVWVSDMNLHARLPEISKDTLLAELLGLQLHAVLPKLDVTFDGKFHGSKDTVFAEDLQLWYRNQRVLLGNVRIDQPLIKDSAYLRADCQDLYANSRLLQDLLSDVTKQPVQLPNQLSRLGDLHYRGILEGRLQNLLLHGAFITRLGTVTTNATIHAATDFSEIGFDGNVATSHFNLGSLFGNRQMGHISTKVQGNGVWRKDQPIKASARIEVQSITFKGYTYRNLRLRGDVADSVFQGDVHINDPNLTLSFHGMLDFSSTNPEANILLRLEHLRLQQLHLLQEKYCENQDMQGTMRIYFTSNGEDVKAVDRINGYITMDSLQYFSFGDTLSVKRFKLICESAADHDNIRIQSDCLTAGVSGSWMWSTLPLTFRHFAHQVLPNFVKEPPRKGRENNNLDFYAYFNQMDQFFRAFGLEKLKTPNSQILKGYIHESDNLYSLQAYVPSMESGNSQLKDFTLSLDNSTGAADLMMKVVEHTIDQDSTKLRLGDVGVFMHMLAANDSVHIEYSFGSFAKHRKGADINIDTYLAKQNGKPLINVHILPSEFYISDTLWTISDAHILYNGADTTLTINNFDLGTVSQHLSAEGVASSSMHDSIRIDLDNINLEYMLRPLGISRAMSVQGYVSGWATLYALFATPVFEANLSVPHATLNYTDMGDLTASATIDRETKHIQIQADMVENNHRVAHLDGNVEPERPYWELFIGMDSANCAMINYWTEGIVDDLQGRGFGQLHIFGRKMQTWVTGRTYAKDASLVVPYTGVRYHFSDSIILDTTYIDFPRIRVTDDEGHRGLFTGRISHDRFSDFEYHLKAAVDDMLSVNLPYDPQSMYYGRVYADGKVSIDGHDNETHIDVDGTTVGNTDFYLSVATASKALDNGFIDFVSAADKVAAELTAKQETKTETPSNSHFYINLNVETTREARVHFLLASHSNDGIVGRGEGNLRLTMSDSDVRLFGLYTIQSGTFAFTLGNLVHRDFQIAEGSTILWNGRPEDPELNVTAKYRLTASLKDLLGEEALNLTSRPSVPVNCVLHMTDKLRSPILRFSIELPQSDESVASQVQAVINTDEMLMRQVVYLLVFNRFFTPEYLTNPEATVGLNETYSLLSSTVTGQINSWLGRLTDIFSLGFNFRTEGEGSSASQEYEAQFQLNPVDRLTINGNFGYRYNDLSNRPFFGDVDLEYQLTKDGKFRAKAYTHTVDKYSLKQANTVQGIGFLFRHDFNWGDARRNREAKHRRDSIRNQYSSQNE